MPALADSPTRAEVSHPPPLGGTGVEAIEGSMGHRAANRGLNASTYRAGLLDGRSPRTPVRLSPSQLAERASSAARGPAYGGTAQARASASMRPIDWMYARSRADARGQPA
jgi:hypothetical protein